MTERYDPSAIEPKWQRIWEEKQAFQTTRRAGHPKIYVLDMFPYPSGAGLHVGHPEGYTATDIVARYKRMRGFDVLHPMGWDAFGLPAEQYAIKTGTHPAETTKKNIEVFRRQLKSLGFSYDWTREVDTTDPGYFRWTQWIFLKLFERGLAVQAEQPVNWCPELGTVLANEEVIDGKSEVGGFAVVRLPLRQWILKITAYADKLLADLEGLDWPDTKAKQIHWIGRSEGTEIDFAVEGHADATIRVFTTRADTLFGVTYVVLAPEHPLVSRLPTADKAPEVARYCEEARRKSDFDRAEVKDKTGVPTGALAVHPLTGAKVPIWVGDYVLGSYGTGAVMAVPAHDERDFAFAKKYALDVVEVISKSGEASGALEEAYVDEGVTRASGDFSGIPSHDARTKITDALIAAGKGARRVNTKLRDWVFSRQRFWGEPIPIYFPVDLDDPKDDPRRTALDPKPAFRVRYDQPRPLHDRELPLTLPDTTDFRPGDDPSGPLARALDWRFFQRDGAWFARETNTMPQWAGSCWYYLRFLDPKNDARIFSEEAYDAWMPVDLYVGGNEHAVLHLLYARFWHKVLFDIGVVKHAEPFHKLVHQGMILGENGEKMSKSRGNVVNPDDVVRDFGADSLRVYEMFMGPLEQVKPWQTSAIQGVRRFLDRVWTVCTSAEIGANDDLALRKSIHKAIKKVSHDIEQMRFNTAVSTLMVLTRELADSKPVSKEGVEALLRLVSPFAPHLAEELWERLGHEGLVAHATWPEYDEALCRDESVEVAVQVNGKVRGRVTLAVDASEAVASEAAKADPHVHVYLEGKTIRKLIYVPGRIVNFIVS